jgi:hypothetical protein
MDVRDAEPFHVPVRVSAFRCVQYNFIPKQQRTRCIYSRYGNTLQFHSTNLYLNDEKRYSSLDVIVQLYT